MGCYSQNQNDVWDNTPERRPKPKSMKSLRNLMSTMGMAPTKVVPIMPERRLVLGTFLGKSARQQRSSSQPELRSRENLLKPKRRHRRGSIFGGATTTTREEDRSVVQQQRRRNPVVEQVVEQVDARPQRRRGSFFGDGEKKKRRGSFFGNKTSKDKELAYEVIADFANFED